MANSEFENYFHDRAALAEYLYARGFRHEGRLIATVALDSLARVWRHDFEAEAPGDGTKRFAGFVQKFSGDARSRQIAVLVFAHHLKDWGPTRYVPAADRLIAARTHERGGRTFKLAFKDGDWQSLLVEEPSLSSLSDVAERYTLPALMYQVQRCALAHTSTTGSLTHDYSGTGGDDEVSYMAPYRLKIGIKVATRWLRSSASAYAAYCGTTRAADKFDADKETVDRLEAKWRKLA